MIKGFFGINIAVNNLEEATAKYERLLGVRPTRPIHPTLRFPAFKALDSISTAC
jgi:catechol 2,3-dioxygenase-like lactoylglutathione lyase family enzyme